MQLQALYLVSFENQHDNIVTSNQYVTKTKQFYVSFGVFFIKKQRNTLLFASLIFFILFTFTLTFCLTDLIQPRAHYLAKLRFVKKKHLVERNFHNSIAETHNFFLLSYGITSRLLVL